MTFVYCAMAVFGTGLLAVALVLARAVSRQGRRLREIEALFEEMRRAQAAESERGMRDDEGETGTP